MTTGLTHFSARRSNGGSPADHWGLHWFRRDLRLLGNPALGWSCREHGGRVLGLFCVDPASAARDDFSPDRHALLLVTLRALRDELRACGGDILVLEGDPALVFERLLTELAARGIRGPATVSFNRDYDPFARARDERVRDVLARRFGIVVRDERDHLVVEPQELLKPSAEARHEPTFYRVYTPFARRWLELLRAGRLRARIGEQRQALRDLDHSPRGRAAALYRLTWPALWGRSGPPSCDDQLDERIARDLPRLRVPLPPVGSGAALARLRAFAPRLEAYKEARDRPGEDGTSRLSIYFNHGALTTTQAIAALDLEDVGFDDGDGRSAFLREIIWREFSYHLLWHRPEIEGRAYQPALRAIPWENDERLFAAWKAGRTGFSLVDAGMRQLATTGWMHNRVRMVVASFLTKDLLIDWRWGERYFMQRLLDGDVAPNNCGWQWVASTGCDPQPVFRVLNPVLQGKRFDPAGDYIRAYVPERRDDDRLAVHEPRDAIVVHAVRRERALAMYRGAQAGR